MRRSPIKIGNSGRFRCIASVQPNPLVITVRVYDTGTEVCMEEHRFSVALLGDGTGPRQGEMEAAARVAAVADRYGVRVEIVREKPAPGDVEPRYSVTSALNAILRSV